MTTISMKDKHLLPDWAVSAANRIEEFGMKWVFDYEHPVPDLERTTRVQIRDESHIGQAKEINLYAECMRRGDKFPPGIMTMDNKIVDFNTRCRAARKLGWPTFPVFIIQERYEGAPKFTCEKIELLGAAFNTGGPKPLTREELTRAMRRAANQDNWDSAVVARRLNVQRTVVQTIQAQFRAETRAEKLGVPFNGHVTPSARALLGQRSEKFSDDVFREAVRLTQDAGLANADVRDLCKKLVTITTGDGDRLTLIANERAVREAQISTFRASGKRKPPLSSRVRTYVEFLVAQNVDEMIDGNPNTCGDYLRIVDEARAALGRLSDRQQRANTASAEQVA